MPSSYQTLKNTMYKRAIEYEQRNYAQYLLMASWQTESADGQYLCPNEWSLPVRSRLDSTLSWCGRMHFSTDWFTSNCLRDISLLYALINLLISQTYCLSFTQFKLQVISECVNLYLFPQMPLLSCSKSCHCFMIKLTFKTRLRIMRACHVTRIWMKRTIKEKVT